MKYAVWQMRAKQELTRIKILTTLNKFKRTVEKNENIGKAVRENYAGQTRML